MTDAGDQDSSPAQNPEKAAAASAENAESQPQIPKRKLLTAKKVLEQFERLARKFNLKLGEKQTQRLRQLRDAGTITASDLPAKLRSEFPSDLQGYNLKEIQDLLQAG